MESHLQLEEMRQLFSLGEDEIVLIFQLLATGKWAMTVCKDSLRIERLKQA